MRTDRRTHTHRQTDNIEQKAAKMLPGTDSARSFFVIAKEKVRFGDRLSFKRILPWANLQLTRLLFCIQYTLGVKSFRTREEAKFGAPQHLLIMTSFSDIGNRMSLPINAAEAAGLRCFKSLCRKLSPRSCGMAGARKEIRTASIKWAEAQAFACLVDVALLRHSQSLREVQKWLLKRWGGSVAALSRKKHPIGECVKMNFVKNLAKCGETLIFDTLRKKPTPQNSRFFFAEFLCAFSPSATIKLAVSAIAT